MRRRTAIGAVAVAGVAVAAALTGGAGWFYAELRRPFAGWSGASALVVLEPGLDAAGVLRKLGAAGVLRRPGVARAWLRVRGGSGALQAGEHRFDRAATPLEVLARIRAGDVLLHAVTVPEGLVLNEIAERFAEAGFGPVPDLVSAFRDPSPIRAFDPHATDLEGYLYPDTYHLPRGTAPQAIAQTLVERFREVIGPDYAGRAAAVGLEPREAVVLASLVEEETAVDAERPRVSRVFLNRLRRGMRLECDPTVLYALRREGVDVARLGHAHLAFDSPWNTYRVSGLPPAPIASPGQESLEAAVAPAEGDELYFVADPDGGHRFSRDLASHLRAVAEWRRHHRTRRDAGAAP